MRSKFLTVVLLSIQVFWDVMPFWLVNSEFLKDRSRVELGYNVMKGAVYFVSLQTSVVTEDCNVMVNSEAFTGDTESMTLKKRRRINRCRYNRDRLYLHLGLHDSKNGGTAIFRNVGKLLPIRSCNILENLNLQLRYLWILPLWKHLESHATCWLTPRTARH
jgi:hypothetical protein